MCLKTKLHNYDNEYSTQKKHQFLHKENTAGKEIMFQQPKILNILEAMYLLVMFQVGHNLNIHNDDRNF